MKRILLNFGMFGLLALTALSVFADRQGYVNTVVLDAGHGGRDPGAVGSRSKEKDITLAIALKVGAYINEHLPDVKVIYTRKTDEFVELHRRARIANENHADLFISIHCNSAQNQAAYGTETFVMGLDRSEDNLEVARKENAAILFEEGYEEIYDGYDPHSPVASIIFSLYQDAYLKQSLSMASHVQDQFRERAQRVDRGVKQDRFLVLYRVTMPGVLVEAGFLSNPREEQYLMSDAGQTHIASAIFRAFRDYKTHHDALAASRRTNGNNAGNSPSTQPSQATQTAPTAQSSPSSQPAQTAQQTPATTPPAATTVPTTTAEQASQSQEAKEDMDGLSATPEPKQPPHPDIVFKVQFLLSRQKKPVDSPEFIRIRDVDYYYHDNFYKYTAGKLSTFQDATNLQRELKAAGYKDAFVVAFKNNERIPTLDAVKILEQYHSQHHP